MAKRPRPLLARPWKILNSKYEMQNKWISVRRDTCKLPNGQVIDDYFVVERPDVVGVVAITEDEKVVFNIQYKHGIGTHALEIPAGGVDKGESPLHAAHRELEEESGYQADKLIKLGSLVASPTLQNNYYHVYLARDVRKTGKKLQLPREYIENKLIPLKKVNDLIAKGEIDVLWTVAPLAMAQEWLKTHTS